MSLSPSLTAAVVFAACALGGAVACGSAEAPAAPAPACEGVELLVAASDYASSVVCGAPGCARGPRTAGPDLGSQPALSTSNGHAFYLARDNDYLFELDPACGTPLVRHSLYDERVKGPVNPHDVAVARDGSLFVTLYNVPRIVVLRDGKIAGPGIDLSRFDVDDGNPQAEAVRIVTVGGAEKAFVTLQRLDDHGTPVFASTRPSMMLRIDVATQKVEETVELAGRNPFNVMAEHDGAFFLAEPGNFDSAGDLLAGIERFEAATSTTRLLVTEADLGGSVSEVAVTEGCGVAITAGPQPTVNPTSLVSFDPETGKVLTTTQAPLLGPTAGYDLMGLAWHGDTLYVGDRRRGGAGYPVHVFEREPGTCNLHEVPARSFNLPERPVALRAAAGR
jgi:hypothetical protein